MNKYLLIVQGQTYEVTETKLRSILVFNSGFFHNDVDILIRTGKFIKRKKNKQITYKLKKI
jgi:hypothetical protein